jgi:hypothetical protein
MHPELIYAEIKMRGKSLTELAVDYELDPTTVMKALKKPSLAGEKAISDFLNIPLHKLWPKRWTKDGQRIRPRWAHLYIKEEDVA